MDAAMKRLLLAVVAMLCFTREADPVLPWRIALFYDGVAGAVRDNYAEATMQLIRQTGTPYTRFNASARTWNPGNPSNAKADSAWFREQGYLAAICLAEYQFAIGGPATGAPYGTNFLNASGTARVGNSPLSGRWGIPCYVICPDGVLPWVAGAFDDTTANNHVAGIRNSGPNGTTVRPTPFGRQTYRFLARMRGDGTILDTLFADGAAYGCIMSTWGGAGSVAALAWWDTTGAACPGSDTLAAAWRYRPRADRPGVTYLTFRASPNGQNVGGLIALQSIFKTTEIRPARKVKIAIYEHDAYPGYVTSFSKANFNAAYDTLAAYGIGRTIAITADPAGWGSASASPQSLDKLRQSFQSGLNRWQPFGYTPYDFNYFAPTDTVGLRQRWNAIMRTCTAPDTFNLAPGTMRLDNLVTGAGIVSAWGTKVLADAGVKTVQTTIGDPSGASGWAALGPAGATFGTIVVPADGRRLGVMFTRGTGEDTTMNRFVTVFGVNSIYDVPSAWLQNGLQYAAGHEVTLYWHTNKVIRNDPFWAYMMSVMGRWFRMFDEVVVPDSQFEYQTSRPGYGGP